MIEPVNENKTELTLVLEFDFKGLLPKFASQKAFDPISKQLDRLPAVIEFYKAKEAADFEKFRRVTKNLDTDSEEEYYTEDKVFYDLAAQLSNQLKEDEYDPDYL